MPELSKAKKATQFIFLVCGLGLSSWAPMVPFAKDRLLLDDAELGLLLLLLGLGAIMMMPLSGIILNKIGSRKVIALGSFIIALTLPLLVVISSNAGMAVALFAFGCGIGMVDVAMNTHGVQVQNLYGKPIMSSLHGLFSVGGLLGSLGLGLLMKIGLDPLFAAICVSIALIIIVLSQYKHLFNQKFEKQTIEKFTLRDGPVKAKNSFQWMDARVLLLGFMSFSIFLSEGAVLDWSALLLRDIKNTMPEFAGAGFATFSVAMAMMRLAGDKILLILNRRIVVVGGCLVAVAGILLIIFSSWLAVILLGFLLIGIGAANTVPVFFSEGGRIPAISPTISISAISTMGYAGQLTGPALLGYVAHHYSLQMAFGCVGLLFLIVAGIYSVRKMINHQPHKIPL